MNPLGGRASQPSDAVAAHAKAAVAALDAALWSADAATGRVCVLQVDKPSSLAQYKGPHLDWLQQIHPSAHGQYLEWIAIAVTDPTVGPLEYRLIGPEGGPHWVRHQLIHEPLNASASELRGVLWAIDEQKRLREDYLTASEAEKANLGQELHDDICQILTGIHYLLGLIEKASLPTLPELQHTFLELRRQLDSGMARTRALAHGLTPLNLVDENLPVAIAALARQSQLRFGVKMDLVIASRVPKHPPAYALHVYRIFQEAISNAVKHGRASHLKLRLSLRARLITISLNDNGLGFKISAKNTGGIGLAIMHSRAQEIAGALTIEPGRRGGTCVRLTYTSPADFTPTVP